MAADRGAFVCQGQSMNIFVQDPNFAKLSSMHFYAWEKGLKTGMYYLRSQAATQAVKFTVSNEKETEEAPVVDEQKIADMICSIDSPADCEACGA